MDDLTTATDARPASGRQEGAAPGASRRTKSAGFRFRDAVTQLAAAQKRGAGEPAYLRWINRPLGRLAAAAAYVLGVTPNAVSLLSAGFSLAGFAVLVTAGTSKLGAGITTVLLAIGYVLDSADGQLARLARKGSAAGEWLDHVLDAGRIPLFHLAVGVSLYLRSDSDALWPVGVALAFALLSSVRFFALTLAEKLGSSTNRGVREVPLWHSFMKLPLDVGFVYLVVLTLPMFEVFAVVYATLFTIVLLLTVVSLRGKYANLVGT